MNLTAAAASTALDAAVDDFAVYYRLLTNSELNAMALDVPCPVGSAGGGGGNVAAASAAASGGVGSTTAGGGGGESYEPGWMYFPNAVRRCRLTSG